MEINRDFILRNLQKLSDFLICLAKQKKISIEEIDANIDKFLLENYKISLEVLLEKKAFEIADFIGENNTVDIKDFADILFLKFTLEKNIKLKEQLSKKINDLYQIYQNKTATYSFEIQSNIIRLS
jgi:hypothetical protein